MKTETKAELASHLPPWLRQDWLGGLLLVLAVVLTYTPLWHAGFIWDDNANIGSNLCIVGPLGLKEIWTTEYGQFFPLVLTTFWVEHALWGLRPLPYHLVNVFLHAACAVLLWRILRRLQIPGAWLGAALWALHPLQVESVAWISEMKNTQSCLFYLLTILFFIKYLQTEEPGQPSGNNRHYVFMLVFAGLALASKTSTVILPVVLCLCAWWMEGRWRWLNLIRTAPLFLMSAVAAALSLWSYRAGLTKVTDPIGMQTWPQRVATAGDVIWFYLGKLLWPYPLMTIYPRWEIDAGQAASYLPLLAVIAILFLLWLKRESDWARPWFFAMAYFVTGLFLFLGLIDQAFWRCSFVEDHLQYLASMGPLALAGAGLVTLARKSIPEEPWGPYCLGGGVLLALGLLSWQRVWVYQNDEALWGDTLQKNSRCWMAYNNLGSLLALKGEQDEAMDLYRKALEFNPEYAQAHNNLGLALLHKDQVDEAVAEFQKTLEINPDFTEAHDELGVVRLGQGEVEEAISEFQKALKIDPYNPKAHVNLGMALLQKGQVKEAIAHFQEALRVKPGLTVAKNDLAKAEAIAQQKANP
ncbi:MAG TPA: tetratricopeptide repeat protein [Candidatus Methylacidiphilales bacterium]|nr:tetratricopeptide repeat protein [Candidatus Methylacidiphilales bacterium]